MITVDKWKIIKIVSVSNEPFYKVFATLNGGYIDADRWQLNSGIKSVEKRDGEFYFYGLSGSCYICKENSYGTSMYTEAVLNRMIDKVNNTGDGLVLNHYQKILIG